MRSDQQGTRAERGVFALVVLEALLLLSAGFGRAAQLPPPPLPVDPTPLPQLLSAAENAALAQAREPKQAVDQYLTIADSHVETAYSAIDGGDYTKAERELDIYKKAAAEAVKRAFSLKDGRRSLAKKIEQRLYKQIKTLELIENRFPVERTPFATAALELARRLRVRALNEAFGSGDVLKNPPLDSGDQSLDATDLPERPGKADLSVASAFWSKHTGTPLNSRRNQIPGDYLNEEEDEHVRQAQQIDERIKVFMKIADRRLAALNPPVSQPADKKAEKKLEEELREWGAVPKVSRAELLQHYARAVEEGIAKLEDAHERNPKSSAIAKALTILRDATDRHLQLLQGLASEMKTDGENLALAKAIDEARFANNGAKEGLK